MIQKVSVPASVTMVFDHKERKVFPRSLLWEGKAYQIKRVGLHHFFRQGQTLYHVFSVETETLSFRLVLNCDNLFWTIEEISDGEAN